MKKTRDDKLKKGKEPSFTIKDCEPANLKKLVEVMPSKGICKFCMREIWPEILAEIE